MLHKEIAAGQALAAQGRVGHGGVGPVSYTHLQAHFYVSDVPDSFVQTADLFLGEYKGGPVEQIAIDKY